MEELNDYYIALASIWRRKKDGWYMNESKNQTEELNDYYKEKERKNIALVDCWAKALWYVFWIAIGIGMLWLMYKGFFCWLKH